MERSTHRGRHCLPGHEKHGPPTVGHELLSHWSSRSVRARRNKLSGTNSSRTWRRHTCQTSFAYPTPFTTLFSGPNASDSWCATSNPCDATADAVRSALFDYDLSLCPTGVGGMEPPPSLEAAALVIDPEEGSRSRRRRCFKRFLQYLRDIISPYS